MTATPQRGDGKGDGEWLTHTHRLYRHDRRPGAARLPSEADLVRDYDPDRPGWVKTVAGDFQQKRSPIALIPRRAGGWWQHKEYAADRPAIAFTVSVAGAYALAEAFRQGRLHRRRGRWHDRQGGAPPACSPTSRWSFSNPGELWPLDRGPGHTRDCLYSPRAPNPQDGLYIQMVGRGLRPVDGKSDCLILDYIPADARNVAMLGDILGCLIRARSC